MSIDLQPRLRGALVTLRPLVADDWDALYAVASDPLIWAQHPARDRHEEPVFRAFFTEALESGMAFTVRDAVSGAVIGSTRFHNLDRQRSEIEIGWTFLARACWGGRHNREMKRLLLAHAFQFVECVRFTIGTQNIRSQRAVERIGGVRVASFEDSVFYVIPRDAAQHSAAWSRVAPPVLAWLLDADPAVRWQVLRDLTQATPLQVAGERARVSFEGLGAALLSLQADDGRWDAAAWNHGWTSTMHALLLLRDLGLEPRSLRAMDALARVRAHVTWAGCGPPECDANRFFDGETEPCINAQVALAGAYFGQDVRGIIARLLHEQLGDGGWNCEAERGSTRSSFHTTIGVLEALLEVERCIMPTSEIADARRRGEAFLLQRRLLRRRSTGERITDRKATNADWTQLAFPHWWHYDVLRGLDYLRHAGLPPDERMHEALDILESKRTPDGRWLLEVQHEGTMPIEIDEGVGRPNRWVTLRALRVLQWSGRSA